MYIYITLEVIIFDNIIWGKAGDEWSQPRKPIEKKLRKCLTRLWKVTCKHQLYGGRWCFHVPFIHIDSLDSVYLSGLCYIVGLPHPTTVVMQSPIAWGYPFENCEVPISAKAGPQRGNNCCNYWSYLPAARAVAAGTFSSMFQPQGC